MMNFWLSWYHPAALGEFELHSPWWISGSRLTDDSATICAAVHAPDLDAAKELIKAAFVKKPDDLEWRFHEDRPDDWTPFCDRFPRRDWMIWKPVAQTWPTEAASSDDGKFTGQEG